MATYYMDTAGSNTAPYDTWGKAATSLQTVADLVTLDGIVYCRGTQTLAATIDLDINSGSAAGYIKFVGCNAGGTVDGTRFVLDGDSAATNCILGVNDKDYLWFENFEFKNATADGVDGGVQDGCVFINCIAHNNGNWGFDLAAFAYCNLIRCKAYNNTQGGLLSPGILSAIVFCCFYGNGDSGFKGSAAYYGIKIVGCVFHDNGDNDKGIETLSNDAFVFNCVFEGTNQTGETGVEIGWVEHNSLILGCRFANLATGLSSNSLAKYGWNYFHNNTADTSGAALFAIPYDGDADTNEIDQDADDGFNDVASDDFNLKTDRTLRRTAIDLNLGS